MDSLSVVDSERKRHLANSLRFCVPVDRLLLPVVLNRDLRNELLPTVLFGEASITSRNCGSDFFFLPDSVLPQS